MSMSSDEAKCPNGLETSMLRSSVSPVAENLPSNSRQLTALEDRELRRVFNIMVNFHGCSLLDAEIIELEQEIQVSGTNESLARLNALYDLKQARKHHHLINSTDIMSIVKSLNGKISLQEAQEVIWEVDENLDESIDWNEFLLMYQRNMSDSSGIEPSKLFHLVQFLMFDSNGNGKVSVDETMNMIYMRYGKAQMEVKLKELFGEDMMETGKEGGEIDLERFLEAVERVQLSTFFASPSGKRIQRHRKVALTSALLRQDQQRAK